jgi:uncharacterized protein (TIGR03000 family)
MYSVVLMMAMTSGADVPVDGLLHRSGNCCSTSCSGSYSGTCYGGCYGSYYGSCYGSCYGSAAYSCNGGSCNGGHRLLGGGLFSGHRHGSCSGSCSGSYAGNCCGSYTAGCSGSYYGGCSGSYWVVPGDKKPEDKKPEDKKPEDKKPIGELNAPAPATVIVSLPADAKLLVDGAATTSTSAERTFVSPKLMPNSVYRYTLKAEFMKDGQPVSVTKTIEVRAGMETRVTIDASEAVASK